MDLNVGITLQEMQSIVDSHLPNSNWKVVINTNKKRLGVCKYRTRVIGISIFHALTSKRSEVLDTLLHEIAHAVVGWNHGHNEVWRSKAIALGCNGNRCGADMKVKGKYVGKCSVCNKEFNFHRKVNRRLFHKACGIKSNIVF